MAKYSDIKGFTVQTVSTDPVASAVAGGAPGSGTSAIMTGGYGTAYSAGTEEWTAADFEIKTVTTS